MRLVRAPKLLAVKLDGEQLYPELYRVPDSVVELDAATPVRPVKPTPMCL